MYNSKSSQNDVWSQFNSSETNYEPLQARRGRNKWTGRVGEVAEMSRIAAIEDAEIGNGITKDEDCTPGLQQKVTSFSQNGII